MKNQFESSDQYTQHIESSPHADASRDDKTSLRRGETEGRPAEQELIPTYRTDTFFNVIVAEGPVEALLQLGDELRQSWSAVTQTSAEEAERHRHWLQREVGGFCSTDRGDGIAAWRSGSDPVRSLEQIPAPLSIAKSFNESAAARGLIVGYLGIDTRREPSAVAVAFCSDSKNGLVGFLGSNRHNYFRVLQHLFYDDKPASFLKALVDETAVGPLPYIHRVQWSDSDSPLRLEFRTEDPRRNGQGLSLDRAEGENGPMIVPHGYLPPEGTSVSAHMAWCKAYAVILRAWECGVDPYFDGDAQLMVSGYGLFGAGVIDNRLQLTGLADAKEEDHEGGLTEEAAKARFMHLYAGLLATFLDDPNMDNQARALASDHLEHVTEWLSENGQPHIHACLRCNQLTLKRMPRRAAAGRSIETKKETTR